MSTQEHSASANSAMAVALSPCVSKHNILSYIVSCIAKAAAVSPPGATLRMTCR